MNYELTNRHCRIDLLYLTEDIIDWREKVFLTSCLISTLKTEPFNYPEDIIIQVLREENFKGV